MGISKFYLFKSFVPRNTKRDGPYRLVETANIVYKQTNRQYIRVRYTDMAEFVSSVPLNNGGRVPCVGLGTWKLPREVAAGIVEEAIKMGYRHIDCACDYGNEVDIQHFSILFALSSDYC